MAMGNGSCLAVLNLTQHVHFYVCCNSIQGFKHDADTEPLTAQFLYHQQLHCSPHYGAYFTVTQDKTYYLHCSVPVQHTSCQYDLIMAL